jgi:hypothetical protein
VLMIVFVVLLVVVANAVGLPVPFRSSVVGTYELAGDGQKIMLRLNDNGTFTESISFRNGTHDERKGTWRWRDHTAIFDNVWVPPSFAPSSVAEEDARRGRGEPTFTDPGNWSISPEYQWGRVVFKFFPDESMTFKKVK